MAEGMILHEYEFVVYIIIFTQRSIMLKNLDIYTDLCSTFPFENYLQLIKRVVRSRKNRLAQIVKQLEE